VLGFGRGLTGAHLGWLGVDLVVAFGYGGSEKVGEVVGEVNVERRGPGHAPSPPDAPARSVMASATVGSSPGKV
jgi:hypothetical protein